MWMPYKYSKESSGPAADTLCPLTLSHWECWLVRQQEEDLAQTLSSSLMMCNRLNPNTIYHPQPLRAGRHRCSARLRLLLSARLLKAPPTQIVGL